MSSSAKAVTGARNHQNTAPDEEKNRSCVSRFSRRPSAPAVPSLTKYFAEIRPTLALAVPIIVGQVSQMLMGITDRVMIGRTGTVPLAASSFAGNVFGVFYVIGIGLMIPVAIFVSRARGAGRPAVGRTGGRRGAALGWESAARVLGCRRAELGTTGGATRATDVRAKWQA